MTNEKKEWKCDFPSFIIGMFLSFLLVSSGYLYGAIAPKGNNTYHYEHNELAKFRQSVSANCERI